MDENIKFQIKRIIEALLFVSSEPLSFRKIREIAEGVYPTIETTQLKELIHELREEYNTQQRAFQLDEIAQGYMLRTREEYSSFIEQIAKRRKERLSAAALEVLAIVAYRHPITRAQIEAIRGVDCSGILQTLLERQLIEPAGNLEVPGRPNLYGITKEFLKHFGLKDLKDLPQLTS